MRGGVRDESERGEGYGKRGCGKGKGYNRVFTHLFLKGVDGEEEGVAKENLNIFSM